MSESLSLKASFNQFVLPEKRTFQEIIDGMASAKTLYLTLYNGTFAALWFTLLIRILALDPLSSYDKTYDVVGDFAKWIQTAALLEVVHSALGQSSPPFFKRPSFTFPFSKITPAHVQQVSYVHLSSQHSSKLSPKTSSYGPSCVPSPSSPSLQPTPSFSLHGALAR